MTRGHLPEWKTFGKTYIDLKDVRTNCKDYCKGIRSMTQMVERKGYNDVVYGRVINNVLVITRSLSKKYGSVYVNKDELSEVFEKDSTQTDVTIAPPSILDHDLQFFIDEQGKEHHVDMRGERTPKGIFFDLKDVARVFQMNNLVKTISKDHTAYKLGEHYSLFKLPSETMLESGSLTERAFLTFPGLLKVIMCSRSGVAYQFKWWVEEVAFASMLGTKDQRLSVAARVIDNDVKSLKAFMTKSASDISCLYLIDLGTKDNENRVFKYGFTENILRRFKEHTRTFGDNIKLDTFIMIPVLDLAKAEADFRKCISDYQFTLVDDPSKVELISLGNDAYTNVRNILRSISRNYCGNVQEQIGVYENKIKDLEHANERIRNSYEMKLLEKDSALQLSLKDNEILRLQLQLAKMKH